MSQERQIEKYQYAASDTEKKIKEAGFPKDMKGMRFFDIGANEGAFCEMAFKRGAAWATGVERNEKWVNIALKDRDVSLCQQDWNEPWVDEGKTHYDLIIWFAASHYEQAPRRIFDRIEKALSPGGMFIWEGGIADGHTKTFSRLSRPDAPDRYPTIPMLEDLLSGFSFRRHGPSTSLPNQGNRVFYHCWKKKPKVVIIKGETRDGKTEMARAFEDAVVLGFDRYISELERAARHGGTTPLIQAIAGYDMPVIGTQKRLESYLRERELILDLVKDYTWPVTQDHDVYILEGGMLRLIKREIKEHLGKDFRVWDMESL